MRASDEIASDVIGLHDRLDHMEILIDRLVQDHGITPTINELRTFAGICNAMARDIAARV